MLLFGINDQATKTLGSTTTTIKLPNGQKMNHKFQIVGKYFPLAANGILGRDFLEKYRCIVDYNTWTLTGICNDQIFKIPLKNFTFNVEHMRSNHKGANDFSHVNVDSEKLKNNCVLATQTKPIHQPIGNILHNSQANETDHLMAYDSNNNLNAFNLPKLMFNVQGNNLEVSIKNKYMNKNLASTRFTITRITRNDMANYVVQINKMARYLKLNKIAIANSSDMFSLMNKANFKEICNNILKDVQIIFYEPAKIIKDENEIIKLISENHDTSSEGHVGTSTLLKKLRSKYYWPNMKASITSYIKNCMICNQIKSATGNLTELDPDQKTEYIKRILKLQKESEQNHPQAMVTLERNHRYLDEHLRSFTNKHHDDWDEWIKFYTFNFNANRLSNLNKNTNTKI